MGSVGEGRFGAPMGVTGWGLGQGDPWPCCVLALLTAIFLRLDFFVYLLVAVAGLLEPGCSASPSRRWVTDLPGLGLAGLWGHSQPHCGRAGVRCFIYNNLLERMA